MNTINFLARLNHFQELLRKVISKASGERSGSFVSIVSLQYDFVNGNVYRLGDDGERSLWMKCTFNVKGCDVGFTDFYCEDKEHLTEWKEFVIKNYPPTWKPEASDHSFSPEVVKYLTIADSIALEGYLCTSGDDYHPGYYSTIILEEDRIILRQINRRNAKSIDHKKDYHMRDLEFFIPFTEEDAKGFDIVSIGNMQVHFNDHSSTNNKSCGDRIWQKVQHEMSSFM